jgi:integrase
MARLLITQQLVANLKAEPNMHKCDVYDTKLTGFIVTAFYTGKKSYYIRFVNNHGKTVQRKIADAGILQVQEARLLAKKHLAQIQMGTNPFDDKKVTKAIPTFQSFVEQTYLPYIRTYKRSWETDLCLLKNHWLPVIGNKHLDEITQNDIFKYLTKIMSTHAPASVNRILILIRYMFNLIIKWNLYKITSNPTKNIPTITLNNKRERYLTAQEAEMLIDALGNVKNAMMKYIVPTLILTGARKSEVIYAKWSEFNLETRLWRIPITKSGKARHVPISDGLIRLLQSIPRRNGCDYVFANPKTNKPYISIQHTWTKVRVELGLSDIRIHDLRHSFASFLVNNGRNLYEVQRILGHSNMKTTERYAHLSQDSLLSAANEITKAIPSLGKEPIFALKFNQQNV